MSDKDTARAILAEVVADAEEYGHGNPALIERARAVLASSDAPTPSVHP